MIFGISCVSSNNLIVEVLYDRLDLRHPFPCFPLPSLVVIGNVVLLQPMDGSEPEQYAVIVSGVGAQPSSTATCFQASISSGTFPPSSSSPTQSPSEPKFTLPFGLPIFISICAGGLAVVLVVFVLAIIIAVSF